MEWSDEMNMYIWTETWHDGTDYLYRFNEKQNKTEWADMDSGKWIFSGSGNQAPEHLRPYMELEAHKKANTIRRFNERQDQRESERERTGIDPDTWDGQGEDPHKWSRPIGTHDAARYRARAQSASARRRPTTAPDRWTTGIDGRPKHWTVGIDGRPVLLQSYDDDEWRGGQKRFRKSRRHNKRTRTKKSRQTKRIR